MLSAFEDTELHTLTVQCRLFQRGDGWKSLQSSLELGGLFGAMMGVWVGLGWEMGKKPGKTMGITYNRFFKVVGNFFCLLGLGMALKDFYGLKSAFIGVFGRPAARFLNPDDLFHCMRQVSWFNCRLEARDFWLSNHLGFSVQEARGSRFWPRRLVENCEIFEKD